MRVLFASAVSVSIVSAMGRAPVSRKTERLNTGMLGDAGAAGGCTIELRNARTQDDITGLNG